MHEFMFVKLISTLTTRLYNVKSLIDPRTMPFQFDPSPGALIPNFECVQFDFLVDAGGLPAVVIIDVEEQADDLPYRPSHLSEPICR